MRLANRITIAILGALLCAGCLSTIVPPHAVSEGPSYDGGDRNSGFVGWCTNMTVYGVITSHARDRYNILINIYKNKFIPPLSFDSGIVPYTNNTYLINKEGLSNFMLMNQWHKDGRK